MKKSLVVLMVVALLLVGAAPAFAAGPGPMPPVRIRGGQFTLAGVITAIDGSVVTVQVAGGNPIVKPFIGQNLPIQTTVQTRFLLKTDTGTVVITLADLQVGQNVSAQGQLAGGIWTANRITVGAKIIHP